MTGVDRATRVVLADDECLFRTSLRQLLSAPPEVIRDVYGVDVGAGFDVVGEGSSGEEAVRIVEATRPDLLLLDLAMPRMTGLDVLRELTPRQLTTRVILLTGSTGREHILDALGLGVHGCVIKHASTEVLFEAMVSVMGGACWMDRSVVSDLVEMTRPLLTALPEGAKPLTAREREVLDLVVAGYANREIARHFGLSEETVKHHVTRLFGKMGVTSRTALAAHAPAPRVTSPRQLNH